MTPRRTLGLCCVHIAQLMTHSAIYTTPFTLQLCYKALGILQRVTKSQKVHTPSHDRLQKLHNVNFVWHRSQGFPERKQSNRNFPLLQSIFLRTIDLLCFIYWVYYSLTAIHSLRPKPCPNTALSLPSSKKEQLLKSFRTFLKICFHSKSHGKTLNLKKCSKMITKI